jgi:predicted ATPase
LSQEKLVDECRARRLSISIGSIKRAEAGKNILYRTLVQLCEFFHISIDDLTGDIPISLWEYVRAQPTQLIPCIGRDWELSLLQKLQLLSKTGLQTACVYGMQGLGKTTLVRHFLSRLDQSQCCALYLCSLDQGTFFRRFICTLLGIPEIFDDDQLRFKIKILSNSPSVYFYLLHLSGLALSKSELQAISNLSEKRLHEVEVLAVMVLIQSFKKQKLSILAIDSLHVLDEGQLRVIKIFTQNMVTQPILIIFSLTDVHLLSYLPDWLQSSNQIQLKSLPPLAMDALVNNEVEINSRKPVALRAYNKTLIQRASGNPLILKALMKAKRPDQDFPEEMVNSVQAMLKQLTGIECRLLQFLAASGPCISIDTIELFNSQLSEPSITVLHKLVRIGLLYPRSESYIFRHILIWEIVKAQLSEGETVPVYLDNHYRLKA